MFDLRRKWVELVQLPTSAGSLLRKLVRYQQHFRQVVDIEERLLNRPGQEIVWKIQYSVGIVPFSWFFQAKNELTSLNSRYQVGSHQKCYCYPTRDASIWRSCQKQVEFCQKFCSQNKEARPVHISLHGLEEACSQSINGEINHYQFWQFQRVTGIDPLECSSTIPFWDF